MLIDLLSIEFFRSSGARRMGRLTDHTKYIPSSGAQEVVISKVYKHSAPPEPEHRKEQQRF
jgi:hypothetical protein